MVAIKKIHIKKLHKVIPHKHIFFLLRGGFWFSIGVLLGFFFLLSFAYILFRQVYHESVFPGVTIIGVNLGGKNQNFVTDFFNQKNAQVASSTYTFSLNGTYATMSASQLEAGYNSTLLAQQAMSIGRSNDLFSNVTIVFTSYLSGIPLNPSYSFSEGAMQSFLAPLEKKIHVEPTDAQFQIINGRVTTFTPSQNGQTIDYDLLNEEISKTIPDLVLFGKPQNITLAIPIKTLYPKITTEKANNLGIKELIGVGTSLFQHSIASRIYNIELAARRLNGIVVAPNEEFSFDRALGDISSFTGYKQAYVIANGHTVLGDGGGVCQVSTTMFRAMLNAGLPITERHAHDYRVGYYEEDSPPGFDATIYSPSVDLKFLNTTGHNILIQSVVDPNQLRLTFYFYGVKDGRQVSISSPVITNQQPAPTPLYQDDPSLPKGRVVQTDFAANGATVSFNRIVVQDGKQIINETYTSNYHPWQAVFLVGTGS